MQRVTSKNASEILLKGQKIVACDLKSDGSRVSSRSVFLTAVILVLVIFLTCQQSEVLLKGRK